MSRFLVIIVGPVRSSSVQFGHHCCSEEHQVTCSNGAGLPNPEGNNSLLTCVEGSSVVPLLKDPKQTWKKASFSQYPRPAAGLHTIPGHQPFDNHEHDENVMGYTMRVEQYRFTEWVRFNRTTAVPNWDEVWGTELYNHTQQTVFFNDENENLANKPEMQSLVSELRKMLRAGWRAALPPNAAN